MARRNEEIPIDKHVFICGSNGSGKSYLAEEYLRTYESVIKLDTKDETDERLSQGLKPWRGLEIGKDYDIIRTIDELYDLPKNKKAIFVPDYYDQNDEMFNQFFDFCFNRQNIIIWVDELMGIGNAYHTPKSLGRVYQQGRSKKCVIWACSQRPSNVPKIALANSDYYFVFKLNLKQDRKTMVENTGQERMEQMCTGHDFWYYKMGDSNCRKGVLT